MKNLSKFILTVGFILTLNSCKLDNRWVKGIGNVVSEERQIQGFSGINFQISATLNFVQDSNYKVVINAQKNIIDVMDIGLSGNQLNIKYKPFTIVRNHKPIVIEIHAPNLDNVMLNGSGNLNIRELRTNGSLKLSINGSGYISGSRLYTDNLIADVNGSGEIVINDGQVDYEEITINGSGKMDAINLTANQTLVNISGSGKASVQAKNKLTITINGSGQVNYRGNPTVTTKINGSGKVNPI